MSSFFTNLVKRGNSVTVSTTTIGLLIALIVLLIVGGAAMGIFLILRRRRSARDAFALPSYNEKGLSFGSSSTFAPIRSGGAIKESVIVIQEKKDLILNSHSPPGSPLPEIRITFPEECDAAGKRTSGRVVVVKVGDTTVGLEPLNEKLPTYEQGHNREFQSIDLERVGGLREKAHDKTWR